MKYLKKIAFTLALIAGLCGGAWAQNWGHRDAGRHWDNHSVYRGHPYNQYRGGWGYAPNRNWGGWGGYYPYRNYGYYPYAGYGYYPYSAYRYYPYNYGYYPGGWAYNPNFVFGFRLAP